MMIHELGIRGFLWLFYGAVFGFVFFPDLMMWLVEDHSFRHPVILGIGAGIAVPIVLMMSVDRQSFDKLSVGGRTGIVLGVALLTLAYSICRHYDISLEELPSRQAGRLFWILFCGGAFSLTSGVIAVMISRFPGKSG